MTINNFEDHLGEFNNIIKTIINFGLHIMFILLMYYKMKSYKQLHCFDQLDCIFIKNI